MKLLHQQTPNIRFQTRATLDFPLHLHDVMEVVFLRAGTAVAVTSGSRWQLEAGDVFISFPNQPHGYEESRDAENDVLIVPAKPFLQPWRSLLHQRRPLNPVLRRGTWEHTGIGALLDLLRPERNTVSPVVLQGYATVILGKLLPLLPLDQRTEETDTLETLLFYVSEHYREPLSRREIAQAVGYNESYISHVFTQQLGMTLMAYITSLRLKDAKTLLTDTQFSVSQISLMLGFGSIRSFNRVFLKEFGVSPSASRRQENQ